MVQQIVKHASICVWEMNGKIDAYAQRYMIPIRVRE